MHNEPRQPWRGHPGWRHAGIFAICAALAAGAIVAAVYTGSGGHHPSASHDVRKRTGVHKGHATHQKDIPLLAAAVTTTADSSSFDFTFTGADTSGRQANPGGMIKNPGGPAKWLFGRPELQDGPVVPDDVVRRGDRRGGHRPLRNAGQDRFGEHLWTRVARGG